MRRLPLPAGAPVQVCVAEPGGAGATVNGVRLMACYGAGVTSARAAARARDEVVERWSGFHAGEHARRAYRASLSELGDAAIDPRSLLLVSARQVASAGRGRRGIVDPARPMAWTAVRSLVTGGTRYVPSRLAWYGHPREPALAFGGADSNGTASGATRADATLRALLELVERDSVALWWYNRVRRPAVDLGAARHPQVARIVEWMRAQGRDTWVLDLTSDLGIPVMAAVSALREGPSERILLGFGAHLDAERAALRALVEMAQEFAIVRAADAGLLGQLRADRRWLRHARVSAERHLSPAGTAPRRLRPLAAPLPSSAAVALCTRLLARRGLEAFVLDQSRGVRRVVKAFVPGLRPWWARFAPGRLYDAPVAAGWRTRRLRETELNPLHIWF